MRDGKSLPLIVLCVMSFGADFFGFGRTSEAGWKASSELVDSLSKRRADTNYRERNVPTYRLPDPLLASDGKRVADAATWNSERRAEVLELFRTYVYGRAPVGRPKDMSFECFDFEPNALGGSAIRKQVSVSFTGNKDAPAMDILVYLPNTVSKPVSTFVLLNFGGNHTVNSDRAIKLSTSWIRSGRAGSLNNRATEKSRGISSSSYPLASILKRGYGLATIYYGDIDPDFDDGFENGVHPLFDKLTSGQRQGDAWGSIGAWAWGLSRAMDYFEADADIDQARIFVLGHSRLGKTALWAGAQDERFALVISNNSGCGGAALSRRRFGETVGRINKSFPHWFCDNFKKFNDNEGDIPVDQHMLIALMAPRPVYVASADKDLWADPRGEFLACKHAEPVYRLLGLSGLGAERIPALDTPVKTGTIGYHVRSGGHALTAYDWENFMDFADKHFGPPGPK
ncbi:MAG: glucuronyl esterase domain-containing protein [Planctomycetota bacterium]|jgi:hypothetical protein